MLSRHLYDMDEVRASLAFCSKTHRIDEATFWCQELLDSACGTDAISILFETWLWHCGVLSLNWLHAAHRIASSPEVSEDDIQLLCYQLTTIKRRDSSLWTLLVLGATDDTTPPERITLLKNTRIPPSLAESTSNPLEQYFLHAITQNKARAAWWATRGMTRNRIWELLPQIAPEHSDTFAILQTYENILGFKNNAYDTIILCCATLTACMWKQNSAEKSLPTTLHPALIRDIAEWKKVSGNRPRRLYTPHTMALYGITKRGCMSYKEHRLKTLHNIDTLLQGDFWETAIETAGGSLNHDTGRLTFKQDDALETFYDTYFPDDIPDEWPLAEQQKSHGDGTLAVQEKPTLQKYVRIWMTPITIFAWGNNTVLSDRTEHLCIHTCNFAEIGTLPAYTDTMVLDASATERLKPVRKIIRIVSAK